MGLAIKKDVNYTFTEYLLLEQKEQIRYEFYRGQVFSMAGGTKKHNLLGRRIANSLDSAFSQKGCQVFMNDVKLQLAENQHYVYPDVMLTCHPDDLKDENAVFIAFPSIIVKILSPSTGEYDRTEKKKKYFKISSLQVYILINPDKYSVEVYEKEKSFWRYNLYESKDEILRLRKFQLEIPMQLIYEGFEIND
jgi:Uma2 family endonuclease